MKIVSFNINSVRARLHQVKSIIKKHKPEVIGLQETKVHDDEYPFDAIKEMGYESFVNGQKGHYGVALLSKKKPIKSGKGFKNDKSDDQKRFIWGEFKSGKKSFYVLNGYFPQGEERNHPTKFPAKRKFYKDLTNHLKENHTPKDLLVLMGDLNISPEEIDIGIGEQNRKRWLRTGKCSFLPEEREWLKKLTSWGLKDTFREIYPTKNNKFSWFDYRSRGFDDSPKRGLRIDQIWGTDSIVDSLQEVGIDYKTRAMVKPSDHAPIWSAFDI